MDGKVKTYSTVKKLNREATIFGLHYNTFFAFMVSATVVLLISSGSGFTGFVVGIFIIVGIYILLNVIQIKVGPKKFNQYQMFYKTKVKVIKGSNGPFRKLEKK